MKEEYNYTLTVPLHDLEKVQELLAEAKSKNPQMRMSRKPDTRENARFYLSFPYKGTRTDEKFYKWLIIQKPQDWDLYGPNYGIWGLS